MLLITAVLLILMATYTILENQRRKRQSLKITPRPNVLLTRFPIVFVSGKKSIFYSTAYWGDLPLFLREHGFDVFSLSLPWRDQRLRNQNLCSFLEDQSRNCLQFHFIFETSILGTGLNLKNFSCVKSSSLIDSKQAIHAQVESKNPLFSVCAIPESERSLMWQAHEALTGDRDHLDFRRYFKFHQGTRPYFEKILDQMVEIAEQDHTQDLTPGESLDDAVKNRPSRDYSKAQDLS